MTNSDYYCVTILDQRDALRHVHFFNSLILKNTQRIDGKTVVPYRDVLQATWAHCYKYILQTLKYFFSPSDIFYIKFMLTNQLINSTQLLF